VRFRERFRYNEAYGNVTHSRESTAKLKKMLFQINICERVSSAGFSDMTLPLTTSTAPCRTAAAKSLLNLNSARSRSNLAAAESLGISRSACSSSFQSRG